MKIVFKIFYLSLFLIQPAGLAAAQESANEKVESEVSNDKAKKIFEATLQSTNSTPLAKMIAKVGLFTIFKEKMWTAEDLGDAAKPEFRGCIIEAINQTTDDPSLHSEALFCWGNIKHYGNNPSFSQAIKYYNLAIQQNSSPRAKFLACFGILKMYDESKKKLIGEILDARFLFDHKKINLQKCCLGIMLFYNDDRICKAVDQELIDSALKMATNCIKQGEALK